MFRNIRWLTIAVLIAGAPGLTAGGDKAPWQPTLPKEVAEELAKRELDTVKTILDGTPDDAGISRAKLGAVLIAVITLSGKDKGSADDQRGVRERALLLAQALGQKGGWAEAKKLSADLLKQKAGPEKKVGWDKLLTGADLMDTFRTKAKGGDGIHPDLQSYVKLKGALNGIEEKIRALSMKELNDAGMKKEAKELELLAYRTAVLGALTYNYAPPKAGKKDPELWRQYSLKMRDLSVDLAAAAQKGDPATVLKVSSNLYASCTQCHGTFK
jgi:hypothetical protein